VPIFGIEGPGIAHLLATDGVGVGEEDPSADDEAAEECESDDGGDGAEAHAGLAADLKNFKLAAGDEEESAVGENEADDDEEEDGRGTDAADTTDQAGDEGEVVGGKI